MYRMITTVPCRACILAPEEGCSVCLGTQRVEVSNHKYETQEGLAIAVAQFILDAVPPSRSPLDTSVANRVLTWDGEGQLTFPLANLTNVIATREPT